MLLRLICGPLRQQADELGITPAADSTTVVPFGCIIAAKDSGNLILEVGAA
jgi:hypothetical protein